MLPCSREQGIMLILFTRVGDSSALHRHNTNSGSSTNLRAAFVAAVDIIPYENKRFSILSGVNVREFA